MDDVLTGLREIFYNAHDRPTPLKAAIGTFAYWRNEVFGHGLFQQEPNFYAGAALRQLHELIAFYSALNPVFDRWRLTQQTASGEFQDWHGAHDLSFVKRHEHQPDGAPVPLLLRPLGPASGLPLSLGPLMTIQQCQVCQQPAAFFYDRFRGVKQEAYRAAFREYWEGHKNDFIDHQGIGEIARHLPVAYDWKRSEYQKSEIDEQVDQAFRFGEKPVLRPDYLADWFWSTVASQKCGYLHLIGEEGLGKSYFVKGLEQESVSKSAWMFPYYILPGSLTDLTTFVSEFGAAAKALDRRTQEVQTTFPDLKKQQQDFVEVLKVIAKNGPSSVIIALDALDELPDPDRDGRSIVDLLPPADKLPPGCFVLLTSRPRWRPKIAATISGLKASSGKLFFERRVKATDTDNQALIRRYLGTADPAIEKAPQQRGLWQSALRLLGGLDHQSQQIEQAAILPARFRTKVTIEKIVERSGGVFLYAFHLARGLNSGAFSDANDLPEAAELLFGLFVSFERTGWRSAIQHRLSASVNAALRGPSAGDMGAVTTLGSAGGSSRLRRLEFARLLARAVRPALDRPPHR